LAEKIDLDKFIKENLHLLTTFVLFAGLTAYLSNLKDPFALSSSFIILILVGIEIFKKLTREKSLSLIFFQFAFMLLLLSIAIYVYYEFGEILPIYTLLLGLVMGGFVIHLMMHRIPRTVREKWGSLNYSFKIIILILLLLILLGLLTPLTRDVIGVWVKNRIIESTILGIITAFCFILVYYLFEFLRAK
jgi:hypothetical protein